MLQVSNDYEFRSPRLRIDRAEHGGLSLDSHASDLSDVSDETSAGRGGAEWF
jgi:hypothetical protein